MKRRAYIIIFFISENVETDRENSKHMFDGFVAITTLHFVQQINFGCIVVIFIWS